MFSKTGIAIHGGAGTILRENLSEEKKQAYQIALQKSIITGHEILIKGGTAVDAVSAAVSSLEDCEYFNAGRGSVFSSIGEHEMDASIMNGSNLAAGAVCGIKGIKNPIGLAKEIMEHSGHVLLSGKGAKVFAETRELEFMPKKYFYSQHRYDQWQKVKGSSQAHLDHSVDITDKKFGTVGAVALDQNGNIAAATSTGGMTNKRWGRIGDSPLIGAGNYANNKTCAVSCTGDGEFFIRGVVAYDISCLMEYKGLSLQAACNEVIHNRIKKIGGEGGVIAIDSLGNVSLVFNSTGMYRGIMDSNNNPVIKIYQD